MKPFVKLFRKVVPKSSKVVSIGINAKDASMEESSSLNSLPDPEVEEVLERRSSISSTDLKTIEDQLEHLKTVVNNLQEDVESKEISIAKLAREKEKLSLDLLKQKRMNTSILKQLEEERKFYFQEKELYCQEMNEMKEFKRNFSKDNISLQEKSNEELKTDLENVKKQLKQTVEANYNLSIKFLRIKNTKTFLKNELLKIKVDHEKIFNDFKSKIEMMSSEVEDIIDQGSYAYVSPSNRKYVQIVRQNSSLVHENLYLHMEIERLNSHFDKIKLRYTKSEANNRLKYVHSLKSQEHAKCEHDKKEKKKVHIATQVKKKDENSDDLPKSNIEETTSQSEVIKIFERCESEDTPAIHILNEDELTRHHNKKHKKVCKKHTSKNNIDISKSDGKQPTETKQESPSHKPCVAKLASIAEIDETENISNKN